jgi:thermitase
VLYNIVIINKNKRKDHIMKKNKIISIIATLSLMVNVSTVNAAPLKNNLTSTASRAVITVNSQQDINNIKTKIPGADVKVLNGGQAIVYSNSISASTLQSKLSGVKGVKNIRKPTKLSIESKSRQIPIQQGRNRSNSIRNQEWDIPDVEANFAWTAEKQVRQIKVAVVDTGVDYNNTLLNGKIDSADGYNFVSNTTNTMDDNGHGTGVSGIITTNSDINGNGLLGIVGNLNIQIIPVKVLGSDGTGDSDIIAEGIQYAADKGADIINLSLGGEGASPEIDTAIQYATGKGCVVVAAAGNDNADVKNYSPASNANVIAVSALNEANRKSYYSNYGANVQLAAPGDDIVSTTLNNKYVLMSGTSMATPIVTGVSAMIKAENPSLTAAQIESILDQSAVHLGTAGKNIYYGYGKVDAYRALSLTAKSK